MITPEIIAGSGLTYAHIGITGLYAGIYLKRHRIAKIFSGIHLNMKNPNYKS